MKRFFILQQESTKGIRKVEEITSPDWTYGEADEGVNRHGLSVSVRAIIAQLYPILLCLGLCCLHMNA